jgi:hypothetical protein
MACKETSGAFLNTRRTGRARLPRFVVAAFGLTPDRLRPILARRGPMAKVALDLRSGGCFVGEESEGLRQAHPGARGPDGSPWPQLTWRMGVEIELMAPRGRTRADLAERVAARLGARVERFFHPQSEIGAAPGVPVFENLTPGFAVIDGAGRRLAAFVDDITLQAGLDRGARARRGWIRIVADDPRLLRLVILHCDPQAQLDRSLAPLAALFGVETSAHRGPMVRVADRAGASVAIAAPLPGERERPCEIVTAPMSVAHGQILDDLLADARAQGFQAPEEAAVHLHFDARPLRSAAVTALLIETLLAHGEAIKRLVGTNSRCVRLGPWPAALARKVRTAGFRDLPWPAAREALCGVGLTKYCDFNLRNYVHRTPGKETFEVRVLPGGIEPGPILEAAALFEALLLWCRRSAAVLSEPPRDFDLFLAALPMAQQLGSLWRRRARERDLWPDAGYGAKMKLHS